MNTHGLDGGTLSLAARKIMLMRAATVVQVLKDLLQLLVRPPVTSVPDGLMFYRRCYLFRHAFSEVPRPIALKLCHIVGIWLNFIITLQKFGGLSPQKNLVPKTCKISVNFGPLQTLIANISGTAEDIQNRKTLQTMVIPPAFN